MQGKSHMILNLFPGTEQGPVTFKSLYLDRDETFLLPFVNHIIEKAQIIPAQVEHIYTLGSLADKFVQKWIHHGIEAKSDTNPQERIHLYVIDRQSSIAPLISPNVDSSDNQIIQQILSESIGMNTISKTIKTRYFSTPQPSSKHNCITILRILCLISLSMCQNNNCKFPKLSYMSLFEEFLQTFGYYNAVNLSNLSLCGLLHISDSPCQHSQVSLIDWIKNNSSSYHPKNSSLNITKSIHDGPKSIILIAIGGITKSELELLLSTKIINQIWTTDCNMQQNDPIHEILFHSSLES